jgi:hypothetical protein
MLKRDGENCEHAVPNYPGLLTTSEHKAYQAVIPLVAEQVRLHNELIKTLGEIDKENSNIAEKIAGQKDVVLLGAWGLRHTLFKTSKSEIAICSRGVDGLEQFGVVERFDPNSAYARAHGDTQEITVGSNVSVVLKSFVQSEHHVLSLYRQDIAATVEEKLAEMFPKLNASRVVRAITARCEGTMPVHFGLKPKLVGKIDQYSQHRGRTSFRFLHRAWLAGQHD